jgi:hypothetical protein
MDAFLKPSATSCKNPNRFLQKVAGQALAMLAMESADNCAAMLMEAGNAIGELASMICENNNRYVAARLLHNVFQNMQPELSSSDMRKLCETLRKVRHICLTRSSLCMLTTSSVLKRMQLLLPEKSSTFKFDQIYTKIY